MNSVKSSCELQDDTINYRHTDPPFLWIAVCIGSISLHLLVFWFLRSSDQFRPWIPQPSQDDIAVELIDIPPQEKLTPQPKSTTTTKPQFSQSTQNSVKANLPKTTLTTPENPNDQVISSDFSLSQLNQNKNIAVNNQPVEPKPTPTFAPSIKPQIQFTPKPTPTFTPQIKPQIQFTPKPTPTFTPTQTIPLDDLPWNRRQEVKLGEGTLLPNDIPSDSPTPTPETSTSETPETPETSPTPETSTPETSTPETSTPETSTPETSTPETSPTSTGGGVLANVDPILKDEVEQLRQEQKLRVDALPDILAEYQGSRSKELELNFLPSDSGLKSANILASLVIDNNGKFQQAVIINIEPATLSSEKSSYEQALNEIFKQEGFVAAYNQDGSKPDLSNLYVRIRIEPINSQ